MIIRKANAIAKSAKMLVHYMHHFGNVSNVVFHVGVLDGKGFPYIYGESQSRTSPQTDWEVYLEIRAAFKQKVESYTDPQTGGIKKKYEPIPSDTLKLCTYVELCPDMVVVDKDSNYKNTGIIRYKIQSINHELPFIRVDFFK